MHLFFEIVALSLKLPLSLFAYIAIIIFLVTIIVYKQPHSSPALHVDVAIVYPPTLPHEPGHEVVFLALHEIVRSLHSRRGGLGLGLGLLGGGEQVKEKVAV